MDDKKQRTTQQNRARGNYRDPIQGFFNFVSFDTGDCWEWTGSLDNDGYGHYSPYRRRTAAHRYSYEIFKVDIPEDFTIDHLCRNRKCVNPAHLEAVTNITNVMRGEGYAAVNARRTHCLHGHLLSGENLYVQKKTGKRYCRTCDLRRANEYQRKKREAKNSSAV